MTAFGAKRTSGKSAMSALCQTRTSPVVADPVSPGDNQACERGSGTKHNEADRQKVWHGPIIAITEKQPNAQQPEDWTC